MISVCVKMDQSDGGEFVISFQIARALFFWSDLLELLSAFMCFSFIFYFYEILLQMKWT